jgi:hypothetical protein
VSLHHQQYGRAGCLSTTSSMDAHCASGYLSTTSSMDVQGVSPPPAVCMCRVSFHHQQSRCAGCHSTTSSIDVQGVSPPCTTSSMDVQGVSRPQAVWTGRVYAFKPCLSSPCCWAVTATIAGRDIGIEAGATGIGIPALIISVRYQTGSPYSGTGLTLASALLFIPVP